MKTRWQFAGGLVLIVLYIALSLTLLSHTNRLLNQPVKPVPHRSLRTPGAGLVLAQSQPTEYSIAQVEQLSRQNYANLTPTPLYPVSRTLVQYRSFETDGTPIVIYARVYMPVGRPNAPILGFAPGTIGIGDECAASLEQPQKVDWANYESHMMTYAGQGYASVITDYEGMRDPNRIHHYMVGELEGRAVLDSLRAIINLNSGNGAVDPSNIIVAGYSQGGHAAFWADQIAATYAPDLHIKGVIGFNPVMDVQQTLADVTRGANLNWFGPYVLVSYADYYHDNYNLASILLPKWRANLVNDVKSHCIDTDLSFWGHDPKKVYTPSFISAMQANFSNQAYHLFASRMQANIVGNVATSSAKLINAGSVDNVVLPQQKIDADKRLCKTSTGPVQLQVYPGSSHYTTMPQSLANTLGWMNAVVSGTPQPGNCPPPSA